MVGLRPIVEMMTFNFALVALDQIVNHAAKLFYMSGGQFPIPLVIRGPGGPAHQLAAQHSQSMESYFCHVPGLKVVRPTTPRDAKGLLKSSIRDDNPVIFIESETLYGVKGEVPDDADFLIPLGVAEVKREGRDVTVIAYSGMYYRVLEAAEEVEKTDGISVEIVDPRTLRPMDTETILGSVRKTHRRPGRGVRRGLRGHGIRDRGVHHGARVRRAGRPGRACLRRRRAHAVREEPRAVEDPIQGADHRRDSQALLRLTGLPRRVSGPWR